MIFIKNLVIGDLVANVPIIQGGMGVGVSRSNLAGSVAKSGGIGIISGAQIGYDEPDFETNNLSANLRSLRKHISKAREISNGGIIGVNLMVAMNNYEEYVKECVNSNVDLIISGAGVPSKLPSFTKCSNVKIAPIVSSSKACSLVLKIWDKKENTTADLIVVEGPKAGGHLGFSKNDLEDIKSIDYDKEFVEILQIAKFYGDKYNKHIPVVAAGGISTAEDVAKYINIGADGVQVGTRFVTTYECDAHENYKNTYINSNFDDIKIIQSPVGLPGRAIHNKFIDDISNNIPTITKCYNCISKCNPKDTPYCISKALINAVSGDVENGLLFCGADAYKADKLSSVDDVISELTSLL